MSETLACQKKAMIDLTHRAGGKKTAPQEFFIRTAEPTAVLSDRFGLDESSQSLPFFSSPQLLRLLDGDAIKRTIAAGVSDGQIGYAVQDAVGRLRLKKLKETLFNQEVEITDGAANGSSYWSIAVQENDACSPIFSVTCSGRMTSLANRGGSFSLIASSVFRMKTSSEISTS